MAKVKQHMLADLRAMKEQVEKRSRKTIESDRFVDRVGRRVRRKPSTGDGAIQSTMTQNKKLAEVARSLHRAAERLWLRVAEPAKYAISDADLEALQRANTQLNRAITKLKLKARTR